MPFDTPLSPQQEKSFQDWRTKQQSLGNIHPMDLGQDYDLRGAFKAGISPDPNTKHWPDTFKKPNHETFSDQSIYSSLTGTKPGHWAGAHEDQFQPFQSIDPFQQAAQRQQSYLGVAADQFKEVLTSSMDLLRSKMKLPHISAPDLSRMNQQIIPAAEIPGMGGSALPGTNAGEVRPGNNIDENQQLSTLDQLQKEGQ